MTKIIFTWVFTIVLIVLLFGIIWWYFSVMREPIIPEDSSIIELEATPKEAEQETPDNTIFPSTQKTDTTLEGRAPITIDYEGTTEEVRERVKQWYDSHYATLHNLIGGPCEPFKLQILYHPGNPAGGGSMERKGIGEDTILNVSAPLTEVKNFEHVLAHEFSHAFLAGIWSRTPANIFNQYLEEGLGEYFAQVTLVKEAQKGNKAYKHQWNYLPQVIRSYDSYTIQIGAATGRSIWWPGQTFNTQQAIVVMAFMEENAPGFIRRLQDQLCEQPRTPAHPKYGKEVIVISTDTFDKLIENSFGSGTIEGKKILDWRDSQPISSKDSPEGTFIRIQFRDISTTKGLIKEGSSINPERLRISTVTRKKEDVYGKETLQSYVSTTVTILDWNGEIINTIFSKTFAANHGTGIEITDLDLSPGAYKVIAESKDNTLTQSTYFLITDDDIEASEQKTLYGILINDGDIITEGMVLSDGGEATIQNGFFKISTTATTKEINVHGEGWERTVFLSDWSPVRLVIVER